MSKIIFRIISGVPAIHAAQFFILKQLFRRPKKFLIVIGTDNHPGLIFMHNPCRKIIGRDGQQQRPAGAVIAENFRWYRKDAGIPLQNRHENIRRALNLG